MSQDDDADEYLARPITHAADLAAALVELDGRPLSPEERALVRLAIKHCSEVVDCLDELARLTGPPGPPSAA